ncbi:MAG TPA: thioredoxin domain-containing protein [Chloroflexota bacterium]
MQSTRLDPPVSERDHVQGPNNAPVTLVEYGDYECPYCGQAAAIVQQVRAQLGDLLRFGFRNFPLIEAHPHALQAAEAAESAGAQGKFWEMHDHLYANQTRLDLPHLLHYAAALGLDMNRFTYDMSNHTFLPRIEEDIESGVRSGVMGTPTFFINEERYDGSWDAESLLAAIEERAGISVTP